jgi:hypothetical protein
VRLTLIRWRMFDYFDQLPREPGARDVVASG